MIDDLAQGAVDLLNDFGYDLTFSKTISGAYNVSTGKPATTSESAQTVRGIFLEYKTSEVDGTMIEIGDRKLVYVPADTGVSTTPEKGDTLAGEGGTVQIRGVRRIKDTSGTIAFICQVRGG